MKLSKPKFSLKISPVFSRYVGDFLLIFCCIVAIVSPCIEQDYPLNHSTHFNLSWAFQYQRQFLDGQFYPRWLEYSNFGFGNATFIFYPPLSIIFTLPFALLKWSVSASLVGSMTIALLLFSIGFYGYTHCFFQRSTSLILTIAALFNPYFLIDIYQRGAIAEVWGIVWLPWILWATHYQFKPPEALTAKRVLGILGLAVSYSLLMLSHLPTLLLFTLLWLILPWCLSSSSKSFSNSSSKSYPNSSSNSFLKNFPKNILNRTQRFKGVIESYCGFFLALGLSSFYLLPAYWDQGIVQLENLHPDVDYYPQNRLLITGLIRGLPKVSNHWFDQTIVPYVLVVIVIAVLGIMAWFLEQERYAKQVKLNGKGSDYPTRKQREVLWWCLTLGVAIVMVTDLGKVFYALPFLGKIQFSWRWLSLTVVPVYLLLGYSYQVFQKEIYNRLMQLKKRSFFTTKVCHSLSKTLTLSLTGVISLVLFVQGNQVLDQTEFNADLIHQFNTLSAQKRFPKEPYISPQTPFLNWHILFQDGLGLGDVYEYRAKAVKIPLPPVPDSLVPDSLVSNPLVAYPLLQWSDPHRSSGLINLRYWKYGKRSFLVNNLTNQVRSIKLRQLYYPGWQFHLKGSPWQTVFPSPEGLAEIPIPPGRHEAIVAYRGTAAEQWGARLTIFFLVLILAIVIRTFPRQ